MIVKNDGYRVATFGVLFPIDAPLLVILLRHWCSHVLVALVLRLVSFNTVAKVVGKICKIINRQSLRIFILAS